MIKWFNKKEFSKSEEYFVLGFFFVCVFSFVYWSV